MALAKDPIAHAKTKRIDIISMKSFKIDRLHSISVQQMR